MIPKETISEAMSEYYQCFQKNKHKIKIEENIDNNFFEVDKMAEYVGWQVSGASKRSRYKYDENRKFEEILYDFHYENNPVIPPKTLLCGLPERFDVKLIRTKFVSKPAILLLPIEIMQEEMYINKNLNRAVNIITVNMLDSLAERLEEENMFKTLEEYVVYLSKKGHQIFANGLYDKDIAMYFRAYPSDFSTAIKNAKY